MYLVVTLARRRYGIDANSVREVLRTRPSAAFPSAGKAVCGAIFFRGACATVFDLGWMLTMKERDLAMDHFKTFLEIAPPGVRTEAVRNAVEAHCKALERRGRERLRAGDAAVAEASFSRSARLAPERPDAFFQLGLARMNQEKLDAALDALEKAVALGRAKGQDVSHFLLPLLDILQRVGRGDEARERGATFLRDPGDADPVTLERIRALLR